jgi:polynucleotide 5'-hydroxyl-kinase GRC3/NOL9
MMVMAREEEMGSRGIQVPAAWTALEPERLVGAVMIIGATDSGKSTLVRWLAERLLVCHGRMGWLDGDIGQSSLGVPSTMSLALLDGAPEGLLRPRKSFFVGAVSPRGHMLPLLVGAQRLRQLAQAAGATALVVDTTGLVAAEAGGGALKEWKIELLQPQTVIAVQAERELEHLLAPLRRDRRITLHVLEPAAAVRRRSPEERAAWRARLFRDYFAGGETVRMVLRGRPVYGLEKAVPGQLLSLNDAEGFSVSLGIILGRRGEELEILTPAADLRQVAGVRIGDLRLDPGTGNEI